MSIRSADRFDRMNDPIVDRLRRKSRQEWDMAGLARQDGDTKAEAAHTEKARAFDQELKEYLMPQDETKMFGETVKQMKAAKPSFYSNNMHAVDILRDAQEGLHLLSAYDTVTQEEAITAIERCRQLINKAKFFIEEDRNALPRL